MPEHVIVLGAGVSGLSAAWRLTQKGLRTDVFESAPFVGGLAGTLREGPHCLDIGPHSFFSEDQAIVKTVYDLFEGRLRPAPRRVKFYYKEKYIDYPLTTMGVLFQMGFFSGLRAALSFLKGKLFSRGRVPSPGDDETVEEWAIASFGEYLYTSFFKPYTEQFWKIPCSELSSRSIPTNTRMSFMNTLKLLLRQKATKAGNSLVEREMCPTYYPDTGFAEIAEQIAKRVEKGQGRIHLGCEVTGVTELPGGRMRVSYRQEGHLKEMECDRVISTVPLPALAGMLGASVPPEVLESAKKLEYRSLVVLGMLTDKQNVLNCGYVYLLNRPYNRMFEMNEFSASTSLPGENILAVEIPCLQNSAAWTATKEELFDMCIPSLAADGFIMPGDVKKIFLVKAAHAYPIYCKNYGVHLSRVMEHFKKYKSLATLGRCGEFRYMDVDECMKRAFDFVESLDGRSPSFGAL